MKTFVMMPLLAVEQGRPRSAGRCLSGHDTRLRRPYLGGTLIASQARRRHRLIVPFSYVKGVPNTALSSSSCGPGAVAAKAAERKAAVNLILNFARYACSSVGETLGCINNWLYNARILSRTFNYSPLACGCVDRVPYQHDAICLVISPPHCPLYRNHQQGSSGSPSSAKSTAFSAHPQDRGRI
ncbi:hypothetical protein LY78DRAFT_404549 [Colletotrichum sublineola]|nr:hypothetical protein LY78DRAFT_404549 [Colletotrichum sublineola]